MAIDSLPKLPVPHRELARYIAEHPDEPIAGIMQPYRDYEAQLRRVYAQDRQNPALDDPHLNVLPLFTEDTKFVSTRARDIASESPEETSRYIMSLPQEKRRAHGSPATVTDLTEFRRNFNIFSESSMAELDWNNVVAAGSSVVNTLLPVPKEFSMTKRKLREYYHEKFCPASDVDLFLYGLTHEEAVEKIKKIERAIRDSILSEVTVVRTKYAITIASQYPVRHVQIVLRVYKSISEILTGFDIDAAGAAYDGKQVYVTPRALGSFITQINHIDLSRRSPSYENRLSKYSHRNFEVYWPDLDRKRVDPTIFERSFTRTLGLARLLVLERLPTTTARDTYLNKRRQERGRPTVYRYRHHLGGNLKDYHEDEVADWLSEEDVSNYHTFTVPYGQKFHAKRIEKLCYTRDLLLNAEWNQPKQREVYLHRHPAFFGRVDDVVEDCCGCCPEPKTPEESEVAEKEAEIYISGKVAFLIDDPGRQQIGSFNPLTEQDWTDMAYVGNTARLCQSIVDDDLEDVSNWLSQEGADPNKRDYTGRTPLHLAVTSSTPGIVKCLVDHGVRLTARLADGRTALHLAAARGNCEMIKSLMEKSIENEEQEEDKRDEKRRAANEKLKEGNPGATETDDEISLGSQDTDSEDGELVEAGATSIDLRSTATGSFVQVDKKDDDKEADALAGDSKDEPDYYQIDLISWDVPCSPVHLAIAEGHEEAVELLCEYGADLLLPVKFLDASGAGDEVDAILTLCLGLTLPLPKARSMAQLLLKLGATSAQADPRGTTVLHRAIEKKSMQVIDVLWENDKAGLKTAINHLVFVGYGWNSTGLSPLHLALAHNDPIMVLKLLNMGAQPEVDFKTWLQAKKTTPSRASSLGDLERNQKMFKESTEQPIITAVHCGNYEAALELLVRDVQVNTLTSQTESLLKNEYSRSWNKGESLLDVVQYASEQISKYDGEKPTHHKPGEQIGIDTYLDKFEPGSYAHWRVSRAIKSTKESCKNQQKLYDEQLKKIAGNPAAQNKMDAVKEALENLKKLEQEIKRRGGKTFEELYPDIKTGGRQNNHLNSLSYPPQPTPQVYEFAFSFMGENDMTETRRDGYIELFEAAWKGDVDRIKGLTLQAWGPNQEQAPLMAAIVDDMRSTPFSVAFCCGHRDAARNILDIVQAQWSPEDKDDVRYHMRTEQDDDEYNSDEASGDDESDTSEPQIMAQKIDQRFTIDNVGQVSMQVKSRIKPLDLIFRSYDNVWSPGGELLGDKVRSLLQGVMHEDDTAGLKYLLELIQHFASRKFDGDEDNTDGVLSIPPADMLFAIKEGKTDFLGLIIKRTGVGLPVDQLVKKTGVALKKKPRYYQGLTVYGKKRNDWATAGRNMVTRTTTGLYAPPVLVAAKDGNLDSVEYFLGDAPHRFYSEFGRSKTAREDSRLKHLKDSPGGYDRAISRWLGADNDLLIHCALLASPCEKSNELLKYLVETCPNLLEKKQTLGDTPLMTACRLGRTEYVKILLDANADQSTRNAKGENILHAVVKHNPSAHRLRKMLALFDPDLRASLWVQRRSLQDDGNTPLHTWVSATLGTTRGNMSLEASRRAVEVLQLLVEYSGGVELEMLNSIGDTPLHAAIMSSCLPLCKTILDINPKLLHRENAVGRTPAEIAHDKVMAGQFTRPLNQNYSRHRNNPRIDQKGLHEFAKTAEDDPYAFYGLNPDGTLTDPNGSVWPDDASTYSNKNSSPHDINTVIWNLCRAVAAANPGKRRLASLNEANDVAARLGEQYSGSRYFSIQPKRDGDDEEEADDKTKEQRELDYAAGMLNSMTSMAGSGPWMASKEEVEGLAKCDDCGVWHD